ncbi:uncharacterized protein EI90DRAFT_3057834 [Cantharellus anzutake]|uniref:uncharacterized protein n=1 Tax=Cantharellus anzutake TaxID=1750568 RepID=UPI001903666D|nr:uncharacterized protein EI90DRAFT_3057834 [Cantharellus anzutake]KAF8331401.1 hypothetical protein EI90DRAFT_3057834 [Cantharellus anzutake]
MSQPKAGARVHTYQGIRSKKSSKPGQDKRDARDGKSVFKSVLDDPFQISWPFVPNNVQNIIFAALTELVQDSGVPEYHISRDKAHRKGRYKKQRQHKPVRVSNSSNKRKREEPDIEVGRQPKLRKMEHEISNEPAPNVGIEDSNVSPIPSPPSPPSLLSHVKFGVNEVTKQLDAYVLSARKEPTDSRPTTIYVFACPYDVNPPSLLSHLPMLVAVCNATFRSWNIQSKVLLIPFPKGSEVHLAHAIKQRRISIMSLNSNAQGMDRLSEACSPLPILSAPWLVSPERLGTKGPKTPGLSDEARLHGSPSAPLLPTCIKQIRTTAPKDMRAAKEARIRGRAEAKAKRIRGTTGSANRGDMIVIAM